MPTAPLALSLRGCARTLALVCAATLLASAAAAVAEGPPLSFSNRHLSMSSEQLDATHTVTAEREQAVAAGDAPLVLTLPSHTAVEPVTPAVSNEPVWDSEFVDSASAATAAGAATVAAASAAAPVAPGGAQVASFAQCMEGAIRGGAGYDESARVCRALFPGQS